MSDRVPLGVVVREQTQVGAETDGVVPQILEQVVFDEPLLCDVTGDGIEDGDCTLLGERPCTADAPVPEGYQFADVDNDGVIDTCVPVAEYTCDTDFDAIGDTPCLYTPYP